MRDEIAKSHSNVQYLSLSSFDKLVDQLRVFASQLNEKNIEINRLQQLCTKNKIDFVIKKEEPKPIVATPPKTK